MEPIEELVRLQVRQLRNEAPNQAAAILELRSLGFDNERIAELLNTTPDTVRSAVNKAKARVAKGSPGGVGSD